MKERLLAILVLIIMMIQPTVQDDGVSFTTRTVVGNILFENAAMIPLAIIMLIVTLMI